MSETYKKFGQTQLYI